MKRTAHRYRLNGGASAPLGSMANWPSTSEQLTQQRHFENRSLYPGLRKEMRLPDPALPWEEWLARFSRENQVDVLSDAFDPSLIGSIHPSYQVFAAGTPRELLLDRLSCLFRTSWNAAEPVVLFRRAKWYRLRDYQIAESAAAEWRTTARDRGAYTLEQLAEMTALNQEQVQKLRYAGNAAHKMVVQRDTSPLLKFCRALTPAQRSAARTFTLDDEQLTLRQRPLLGELLFKLAGVYPVAGRTFRKLEFRDIDARRTAVTLVFRDRHRCMVVVNREASPLNDPWSMQTPRGE